MSHERRDGPDDPDFGPSASVGSGGFESADEDNVVFIGSVDDDEDLYARLACTD